MLCVRQGGEEDEGGQDVVRAMVFYCFLNWVADKHPDWDEETAMRHLDNQMWRYTTEEKISREWGPDWREKYLDSAVLLVPLEVPHPLP